MGRLLPLARGAARRAPTPGGARGGRGGRRAPLARGAARRPPTSGGRAAVPAARLRPFRRSRARPLGGEPVLPALHRRDPLPAPVPHPSLFPPPPARPPRRGGRGAA